MRGTRPFAVFRSRNGTAKNQFLALIVFEMTLGPFAWESLGKHFPATAMKHHHVVSSGVRRESMASLSHPVHVTATEGDRWRST